MTDAYQQAVERSEHFKAAVRAVHAERGRSGCPGHEKGALCPNCSIDAVRAALPHLERHFRAQFAEEMRSDLETAFKLFGTYASHRKDCDIIACQCEWRKAKELMVEIHGRVLREKK